MSSAMEELGGYIEAKRPDCVVSWEVVRGELSVNVAPANLAGLVEWLKTEATCRFSTLIDITAVDHPERAKRFETIFVGE